LKEKARDFAREYISCFPTIDEETQTMSSETLFGEVSEHARRRRPKKKSAPVFKHCASNEQMILPPNVEELIPKQHLVRVVSRTIDDMRVGELLERQYKGGGTSAYLPAMMIKLIIYAYVSKVYSSRNIAKAARQDVTFMWLAGMNHPDFRTINNFRSGVLKPVVQDVFTRMILFLMTHKYVDLQHYFVDGTKLRADANCHTPVWRKNTKRFKERVQKKIKEHLDYIDSITEQENHQYGDHDLEELGNHTTITSDDIKREAEKLRKRIQERLPSKRAARVEKKLMQRLLPKLEKYEQQERLLGNRNSYSRTDPAATFFRTAGGELLPMYNILMGTQHQFVLHYSIHQKASETDQFATHMTQALARWQRYPGAIVGDSTYGSEDNYRFLETHGINNYLKYTTFHAPKPKLYGKDQFVYDSGSDTYQCPTGRSLRLKSVRSMTTPAGAPTTMRLYMCTDCSQCPVAAKCKRAAGPRTIAINPQVDAYREQARINLESETGITLRVRRSTDVEPTFGDIKGNGAYNRFRLRGLEKVNIEFGLLSMAHNMKKLFITTP
jgi:transposase